MSLAAKNRVLNYIDSLLNFKEAKKELIFLIKQHAVDIAEAYYKRNMANNMYEISQSPPRDPRENTFKEQFSKMIYWYNGLIIDEYEVSIKWEEFCQYRGYNAGTFSFPLEFLYKDEERKNYIKEANKILKEWEKQREINKKES